MTEPNTDINRLIAEWTYAKPDYIITQVTDNHISIEKVQSHWWNIPLFTESLDSCAIFEAKLFDTCDGDWAWYLLYLYRMVNEDEEMLPFQKIPDPLDTWLVLTATPQQRCEAWRRTIEQ